MSDVVDIAPLMAARSDPSKIGIVMAYASMAEDIARRDPRFEDFAWSVGRLWAAMVRGYPMGIVLAARQVEDELRRLGIGAAP